MSVARAIRSMIAAGLSVEHALIAAEALEAEIAPVRSKAAERTARWRANKASQNVTVTHGDDVTEVSPKEIPPTPPKEITPSNPQTPIGVSPPGAAQIEGFFARFKATYPKRDGNNPWEPARKKFAAALRQGVEAETIIQAAARYAEAEKALGHIATPFVKQAVAWLNARQWQDYGPPENVQPITDRVFVRDTDEAWPALAKRFREARGKDPPRTETQAGTGWSFPKEWIRNTAA